MSRARTIDTTCAAGFIQTPPDENEAPVLVQLAAEPSASCRPSLACRDFEAASAVVASHIIQHAPRVDLRRLPPNRFRSRKRHRPSHSIGSRCGGPYRVRGRVLLVRDLYNSHRVQRCQQTEMLEECRALVARESRSIPWGR